MGPLLAVASPIPRRSFPDGNSIKLDGLGGSGAELPLVMGSGAVLCIPKSAGLFCFIGGGSYDGPCCAGMTHWSVGVRVEVAEQTTRRQLLTASFDSRPPPTPHLSLRRGWDVMVWQGKPNGDGDS